MSTRAVLLGGLIAAATFAAPGAKAQRSCDGVGAQATAVPGTTSYVYQHGKRDLLLHVLTPTGKGPHPAMLFFFGGGWRTGKVDQFLELAQAAQAKGFVAVLADYRVTCRDGTNVIDSSADANAALAWLDANAKRLGIDRKRVVISGGSAGGHLAAYAGLSAPASDRPVALVLFNPALDIIRYTASLRIPADKAAAVSPSVMPLASLPPTIIFHGVADTTVPIQVSRDFCAKARALKRECTVIEYPGMTHGFFNSRTPDPKTGISPHADTTAKTLAFLAAHKL
jgi:acetyl esterase/lipase